MFLRVHFLDVVLLPFDGRHVLDMVHIKVIPVWVSFLEGNEKFSVVFIEVAIC